MALVFDNPASALADPSHLSFLRGLGIEESDLAAELAMRQAQARRNISRERPAFADRMTEGLEQIGLSAEDRGMFRSGRRLLLQDRFARDVNREQTRYEQGQMDNVADAQRGYERGILDIRRRGAESALEARTRVGLRQADGI